MTPNLRPLPLLLASLFFSSFSSFTSAALAQEAGAPTVQPEALNPDAVIAASANVDTVTSGALAPAPAQTQPVLVPVVARIEVSAARLKNARIELSPKVGTTVYTIDQHMVETLGQGDDTSFDQVLLRLPGVAQDSKASGAIHVRDDHGNVQYRVNGVQLPESISGFGQSIDTRFVEQINFITGALPAQFGLRTSGIVDIETKEGTTKPGGRIGMLLGSHDYVMPSAEFFGSKGALNYYVSGSYLSNAIGIENPTPSSNVLHDHTRQGKSFGSFSYLVDDDTRVGLMFGTYNGRFQIPDNPGQAPQYSLNGQSNAATGFSALPSSRLNENQREENRFLVLSLQKSIGDINYQVSAFHQYSQLHFTPDPLGDLMYNGVASDTLRSNAANGAQFDISDRLNERHTLRAGLAYTRQLTQSNNSVGVFSTDSNGAQNSNVPITIVDNSSQTGTLASFYLQDEWHLAAPLTLNYGLRFDHVSAFTDEQQWSPRLNLAYKLSTATSVHAGYSRYFTPPPQELAAQKSIDLYAGTSNAAQVGVSNNAIAERTHYFDLGLSHQIAPGWSATVDAYYKKISNMLDEGQFGQALILSPFNYAKGNAKGLELSTVYDAKTWGSFLNITTQKAQGENIISGQALFGADELAYIANHFIYVDHDQTYTVSGGAHIHFGATQLSGDFLYGSGLRRTPLGGAPNSAALPSYITLNLALTHEWKNTAAGKINGRLALVNLFDQSYLLRDGSGVGVGAPQYGARRSLYAGVSSSF